MLLSRRTRNKKEASPAGASGDPSRIFGPAAAAPVIDMLPIPAAIVECRDGRIAFETVNRPFRLGGLGTVADQSPLVAQLGPRIVEFFQSEDAQIELDWELGEAVDCRYFRVRMARRTGDRRAGRCLITLIDQTAELRTQRSLRREMLTDSLTGLPNRAGFGEQLEAEVEQAGIGRYAVLVINLDRFNRINACLGGLSGDELLISVARRIKGALRAHRWRRVRDPADARRRPERRAACRQAHPGRIDHAVPAVRFRDPC